MYIASEETELFHFLIAIKTKQNKNNNNKNCKQHQTEDWLNEWLAILLFDFWYIQTTDLLKLSRSENIWK